MLSTGDDTFALDTLDIAGRGYTREERVSTWTFPVPSSSSVSCEIHHRSKPTQQEISVRTLSLWKTIIFHSRNIDTLAPEFLSHSFTALFHQILVPGRCDINSSREDGDVIRLANTDWGIFEAESIEVLTSDTSSVTYASVL